QAPRFSISAVMLSRSAREPRRALARSRRSCRARRGLGARARFPIETDVGEVERTSLRLGRSSPRFRRVRALSLSHIRFKGEEGAHHSVFVSRGIGIWPCVTWSETTPPYVGSTIALACFDHVLRPMSARYSRAWPGVRPRL